MAGPGVRLPPASSSLLLVAVVAAASLFHAATSQDPGNQLLQGINGYRTSLNLSTFTENQNAACLADQIALQFKGQDCTNSTGANTVPGTEEQFSNDLDLLSHCHLNAAVTQDGAILPACVPGLVPSIVLSNFTKSQYNEYLNDSSYVGTGIGSEGNWIVVVLTTNTPQGNFVSVQGSGAGMKASIWYHLLSLFLGSLMVLMS